MIMQWLGVSAAVALCALLLLVGAALLSDRNWRTALAALAVIALTLVTTTWSRPEIETAYASYTVTPVDIKGAINPRAHALENETSQTNATKRI